MGSLDIPAIVPFASGGVDWQSLLVRDLQPPDSQHLEAARGWTDLLAFEDAARELELISSAHRDHPHVLEVRWGLAANAGRWDEALAVARSIATAVPSMPEGWIYQGSALAELDRYAEAYSILLQGHQQFPQDEILAYDLSCVCCLLDREEEAVEWIFRATALAGSQVLERALEDPDLAPIRDRLKPVG